MRDWPEFFRNFSLAAGAVCAVFFGGLWLVTGRVEHLGAVGGLWALGQLFAALSSFAGRRPAVRPLRPPPE